MKVISFPSQHFKEQLMRSYQFSPTLFDVIGLWCSFAGILCSVIRGFSRCYVLIIDPGHLLIQPIPFKEMQSLLMFTHYRNHFIHYIIFTINQGYLLGYYTGNCFLFIKEANFFLILKFFPLKPFAIYLFFSLSCRFYNTFLKLVVALRSHADKN